MPKPARRNALLAAAALVTLSLGGAALLRAQPAWSPPAGAAGIDPAQLPEIRGTISRYTLTPRGEVDGFLLGDGTQVHVAPHLSTQLVFLARPGDAVAVRGLRALGAPLVDAVSVARADGGPAVVDAGGGPRGLQRPMEVEGRVQAALRGPRGEVNGAVLEDGTILRLPPPETERLADLLRPGQAIAARGDGLTSPLGTVIEADQVGPSPDRLTEVGRPPRPPLDGRGPRPPRG